MPLVIPSLSWTGLDYILAPETQNLIVNYAVTSAVEHPWTTSFLSILALFAILPVLGLVIALIALAVFVLFWLGVVLFVFAAAMAVAGMFAAGAWLYCVALVVSTRWFLGLFTSTNVSDTVDAATTTTTTTDAGKPPAAAVLGAGRKVGVKKDKEVAPASAPQTQTQLQRMEVKHEPVEEEWSEEKEERDGDDEKTLHGLSTDDEAPKKVGEVSERERMRRNIQKSLR